MFLDAISNAFLKIINSNTEGALLVLAFVVIIYLVKIIRDQNKTIIEEKDSALKKTEQTNVVLKAVNDTMKEVLIEIEHKPYEEVREKKRK